ncbi:unknown [Bacteroides sp. CAG:633]|nr:unknown [Bacteroides sp. CAG:633]
MERGGKKNTFGCFFLQNLSNLTDINDLGINLSKRYTAWERNKVYFCSENKLLTD